MQRYRGFLLFGLAAGMALLTSVLVYNWLEQQQVALKPGISKIVTAQNEMVAVAATDLFWGTKLTPEMIQLVPFPPNSLPHGYFPSVESLNGRVLLANVTTNEPILETKLAPIDVTRGGVAAVTQPEKRAMAIKVDNVVGVAGFINPGNRVDVLVTLPKEHPITKTVLQNVLVLATGTEIEKRGDESKPLPVQVVTVEVSPEEGEKLALAANEGKLQLSLRNHLNTEPVLTAGATVPSLLNSYRLQEKTVPKKKVDSKPPVVQEAPQTKVEVIKGGTVSTLTFKEG